MREFNRIGAADVRRMDVLDERAADAANALGRAVAVLPFQPRPPHPPRAPVSVDHRRGCCPAT
jgi:hypothetical protein